MSAIIPQKTCSKCKQDKPASTEFFPVRRASKDGLGYQCHECNRRKASEWRKEDPERARQADKRKLEKIKQDPVRFARYLENERIRGKRNAPKLQKRYREANRDIVNQRCLRSYHRRVQREGSLFVAVANHKRRTLKLMNGGSHTREDIERLYEEQERRCFYCGISLHGEYHVEHIKPLSRGGSNAPDNLACTCQRCNLSKHDKTLEEWKAVRGW